MHVDFNIHTQMQYKIRALQKRVNDFESGSAYTKIKNGMRRIRSYYERKLSLERKARMSAEAKLNRISRMWFDTLVDVQNEYEKRLQAQEKFSAGLQEVLRATRAKFAEYMEAMKAKYNGKMKEAVEARAELQLEKEKNHALKAQINNDFTNSSIPSSRDNFRKPVQNNREATGRSRGGQTGHAGNRRKTYDAPDRSVFIDAASEIKENPDWYIETGDNRETHKQVVSVALKVTVTDYWCYNYRNRVTGKRYHPAFPENVTLEVNYDETVKSMIFFMKNHLNLPDGKIHEFFRLATEGKAAPSKAMINGINHEFSGKTTEEQKEIFSNLVHTDVMHTDMTAVRHNGKNKNILICTDKKNFIYCYRDTKGFHAIKMSPLEFFQNIVTHDHDKTFYHYGSAHQECQEHHMRYLKGAMENEPDLTWHGKMLALLKDMNDTRQKAEGHILTEKQITEFEKRYDDILDLADREYEDNPPSDYYRKGYNLSKELRDYREANLLFLRHPEVDFTNNEAERALRKVKRHMAVSGTFRGDSNQSGEDYCSAMSVLQTLFADEEDAKDVLAKILEYFARRNPNMDKEAMVSRDEKGHFAKKEVSSDEPGDTGRADSPAEGKEDTA